MMADERIDTRLLEELTEQSQDLNSDAMRITHGALTGFAEAAGPARAGWRRGGLLTALVGGAGLLGAARAAADSPSPSPSLSVSPSPSASASGAVTADDIRALQTAASLENLAVSVYRTAAGLPFIKDGNTTVAAFIAKTTEQHQAHAQAFNAAATAGGGMAQTGPDPTYKAVVDQTLPTIKTPADVVKLAISLEDVAAQTYTRNVGQVSSADLRKLFASVAPVEAQHRAVLLAVQALLAGNAADLITIPVDPAKLPAAAGSVGFPDAFYKTDNASPITEGAVQ
ncbi:ferritin-like domain-containing protein [Streptomyces sp. SP17BM10]|uniref:ferritin-like domain-containing protein n=1 Tax=Streptomyces sp. SP17BM10 TaxID=3002530 RepID=UPI002E79AAD2|nr:ferritin-like domain-containing protein [Streptomyces sp. SP17BM10]MEE1788227.1 ferritin-like domain-containing protein [Streptomyces sp. SP17BM10]